MIGQHNTLLWHFTCYATTNSATCTNQTASPQNASASERCLEKCKDCLHNSQCTSKLRKLSVLKYSIGVIAVHFYLDLFFSNPKWFKKIEPLSAVVGFRKFFMALLVKSGCSCFQRWRKKIARDVILTVTVLWRIRCGVKAKKTCQKAI